MFLVDWTVKMRIRPPEVETSICDAKYHVSLKQELPPPLLNTLTPPPPLRRKTVFGLVFQGEFVGDKSFSLLVQADWRDIDSGRGPDWRYLPQSTVKCRFLYETGRSQEQVPTRYSLETPYECHRI
ncbi:hypothetical protein F511_10727 [Dorcoceras hygrometricum]|uniref:Uncharacterized protein n=1 Tax=Dorcoceras hygrometricum TaxID=472368 RepID=A0A2Z7CB28_9LAMI|nr:hypothetical protein F511_10727 [Dorcoceras hygrometricum]